MFDHLTPGHPYVFAAIVLAAIAQDDLTCIAVGFWISVGELSRWRALAALAACFLGTLLGDLGWFFGARYAGRIASKAIPARWLSSSKHVAAARGLLRRYGALAIVASRFLPGLRTPVQVLAGLGYARPIRACFYFTAAAAAYAPLFVGVSAAVGDRLQLQSLYHNYGRLGRLAVVGAAVAIWLLAWFVRHLAQRRVEQTAA
jgi:membrane-associated protein